jgi:hypothetical protein
MLAGVGDVAAMRASHSRASIASKLRPRLGFIFDPVQYGLPTVEVDELLERERIPDHVRRHVLDGLLVLERDRLTDMRRETRMAPGEKLSGEILAGRIPWRGRAPGVGLPDRPRLREGLLHAVDRVSGNQLLSVRLSGGTRGGHHDARDERGAADVPGAGARRLRHARRRRGKGVSSQRGIMGATSIASFLAAVEKAFAAAAKRYGDQ